MSLNILCEVDDKAWKSLPFSAQDVATSVLTQTFNMAVPEASYVEVSLLLSNDVVV